MENRRRGANRTGMVVPKALVEGLSTAPVVVVIAPPGYGKTVTVRHALAGEAGVAWYDAQPWEHDAFVPALIERVRDVRPDAGRRALALAAGDAPPERIGAAFGEELGNIDAPLRIVIDDAHALSAAFGPFVRALAATMPQSVRIVILTRRPIEMGLPQLIASGRAALVDAEQLRFDDAAVIHVATGLGLTLDRKRAAEIVRRTDGWPLASALTLRTSSDALLAELVEARIRELQPSERELLTSVAMYEVVQPDVVAPGDRSFAAAFERLASDATLASRVADGYRIHPLVRETITRRIDPAELAERHAVAALAYAQSGRLRPALFHLERAHVVRADIAFLRDHAQTATTAGLSDGVRASLGRVRASGADEPALIALVDGLLAKFRGDDPRRFFAAASAEADARGDELLAFAARIEGIEANLARGGAVSIEEIDELLARGEKLGPVAAAGAAARAGWADAVAGRFAVALARLDAVPDTGDLVARSHLAPLEAYAHLALGEFEAADRIASEFVELSSAGDELARYAGALVWAARFALLRGETTAAYELAREGERVGRPFAQRSNDAAMHLTLAESALHVGDVELARRSARAAERAAGAAWYARDADRARALAPRFMARAAALDGDPAAARAMLTASDALSLADAAIFAVLERHSDTDTLIARARASLADAVPIDAGDAIALWAAAELLDFVRAGRKDAGKTAIVAGSFEGLIARRLSSGSFAERVARAEESPAFEIAIAQKFLGNHAHAGNGKAPDSTLVEPLTARELEILELLVAGLTNGEMAQRLVVSPRTVETHVARITGKFAVNSRARAVARAIALGIVAPAADAV